MGLVATDTGGGDFELIPQGSHAARAYRLIDLGTQESPYGKKQQCLIAFELPGQMQTFDDSKGPEPSSLSRFFTVSLSEKANLRGFLEQWRGRAFTSEELAGFDLRKIVGQPCLLTVTHKENAKKETKAVITGITSLPAEMTAPAPHNPTSIFAFDDADTAQFDSLPEWITDQIMKAEEYPQWVVAVSRTGQAADAQQPEPVAGGADDVPF